jgi:hypothetical protein
MFFAGSLEKNQNEQLVAEKTSFLAFQKQLLLKEHKLKMKILTYDKKEKGGSSRNNPNE